jgi:hypothetical protein
MATVALLGDAFFSYNLPISPFGVASHSLAHPLTDIVPINRRARYDWWAEDLVNREVVTLGGGVREIMATIRFENEPDELTEMMRLALQYDLTLSYSQNAVVYPMHLVSISGASAENETPLQPDRDRYGYGEWECRLHLRRIDGGTLDGIFVQT